MSLSTNAFQVAGPLNADVGRHDLPTPVVHKGAAHVLAATEDF